MDRTATQLLLAIQSPGKGLFEEYFDTYGRNIAKQDFQQIIAHYSNPAADDLKAFTMAAMQGLCANPRFLQQTEGLQEKEHGATWDCLAMNAVEIARATLSELSKQQHG